MFFNCCKKMFRSKRLGACVISLVFLLSCRDNKEGRSADTTGEAPSELLSNKNRQGDRDHMQALVQSILDKDPRATLLVKKVGSAANSELQKLAQHKDQEVREIALLCLNETGGPDAAMTFVRSLRDEDSQVRAVALRGLQRDPDLAVYPALLQTYDNSADSYVRQQIPLIIGRMRGSIDVQELKQRYKAEKDSAAQEGGIVASARLNDKEAQTEFIKRLHASQARVRARYLEYCEYIHAPWLLKPLLPILDDKTPMVRVGVDARPDLIESLRACDLAINLIAAISGRKFSFAINRATNYNDTQLTEVRRYVQGLP